MYTKKALLSCSIFFAVTVTHLSLAAKAPQSTQAVANASSERPWLDHWRLSTFSFGKVSKDQDSHDFFEVLGTGISVAIDEHTGYIVTAKHVFYDPDKNWHPSELRIRFAWEEQKSVYDDLGAVLKLRNEAGTDLWLAAEDGSDVAAISTINQQVLGLKSQEAIFLRDFASADDLFEGGTVVVLGYPGIVGNQYLVRAVVRAGIVSWEDPASPFEKPFLIDANIYPGNSGGPVIKVPIGLSKSGIAGLPPLPKLLGIVSQAPGQVQDITLRVPGVLLPLTLHQTIPFGGTGLIVPASKVARLIESLKSHSK